MPKFILTIAALLAISVTPVLAAEPQWCSGEGRDKITMTTGLGLELNSSAGREILTHAGSVGTGLNGTVYTNQNGKQEVVMHAEVVTDAGMSPHQISPILIFRDRVFWHCT